MKSLWIFLLLGAFALDQVSAGFWNAPQRSHKPRPPRPPPNHHHRNHHPLNNHNNGNGNLQALPSMTHSQIVPYPKQHHHHPPNQHHHSHPPKPNNNRHHPRPPPPNRPNHPQKSFSIFPGRYQKTASSNIHQRVRPPPHHHRPVKSYRPPLNHGNLFNNKPQNRPRPPPPSFSNGPSNFKGPIEQFQQTEYPTSSPPPTFHAETTPVFRPQPVTEFGNSYSPIANNNNINFNPINHNNIDAPYESLGLATSPNSNPLNEIVNDKEHGWTAPTYKGWRPIARPPSYYLERQKNQQLQQQGLLTQQSQIFPMSYPPPPVQAASSSSTTEIYKDVDGKHKQMMMNTLFRDNVKSIKPQGPVKLKDDYSPAQKQQQNKLQGSVVIPLPDEVGASVRLPTNVFYDDFGSSGLSSFPISFSQQSSPIRPYPHPDNNNHYHPSSQQLTAGNNLESSHSQEVSVTKPFPKFRSNKTESFSESLTKLSASPPGFNNEHPQPSPVPKFKPNRPKYQRPRTTSTTPTPIKEPENDADELGPPKVSFSRDTGRPQSLKDKINKHKTRVRGPGRKPDAYVSTEDVSQALSATPLSSENSQPEEIYPQKPGPPYPEHPPQKETFVRTNVSEKKPVYGNNFNEHSAPPHGYFETTAPQFGISSGGNYHEPPTTVTTYRPQNHRGSGEYYGTQEIRGPSRRPPPRGHQEVRFPTEVRGVTETSTDTPVKAIRAGPVKKKKVTTVNVQSTTTGPTGVSGGSPILRPTQFPPQHGVHNHDGSHQKVNAHNSHFNEIGHKPNGNRNNENPPSTGPFFPPEGFFFPPEFTSGSQEDRNQPVSFMNMPGAPKPNVIHHPNDYQRPQHQLYQPAGNNIQNQAYPVNILGSHDFPNQYQNSYQNNVSPSPFNSSPAPFLQTSPNSFPLRAGPSRPPPSYTPLQSTNVPQRFPPKFETTTPRNPPPYTPFPNIKDGPFGHQFPNTGPGHHGGPGPHSGPRPHVSFSGPPGPHPPHGHPTGPGHHSGSGGNDPRPHHMSGHFHGPGSFASPNNHNEVYQRLPTNSYKYPVIHPGPGPNNNNNNNNDHRVRPPPPHPHNHNRPMMGRPMPPPSGPPRHEHFKNTPHSVISFPGTSGSSSEQFERIPMEFVNHLKPILLQDESKQIPSSTPFSTTTTLRTSSPTSPTYRVQHDHQSPIIHPPSSFFEDFLKPFHDTYTSSTEALPVTYPSRGGHMVNNRPHMSHQNEVNSLDVYPSASSVSIPKPQRPPPGSFDSHNSPSVNFVQFLHPNQPVQPQQPQLVSTTMVQTEMVKEPVYSVAPIHDFPVMTTTAPMQQHDMYFSPSIPQMWSQLKTNTYENVVDYGYPSSTEAYYPPLSLKESHPTVLTPKVKKPPVKHVNKENPTIVLPSQPTYTSQEIRATHRPVYNKPHPVRDTVDSSTTFKPSKPLVTSAERQSEEINNNVSKQEADSSAFLTESLFSKPISSYEHSNPISSYEPQAYVPPQVTPLSAENEYGGDTEPSNIPTSFSNFENTTAISSATTPTSIIDSTTEDHSDPPSTTFTSKRYIRRRKPGQPGGLAHRRRFFSSRLNQTESSIGLSSSSTESSAQVNADALLNHINNNHQNHQTFNDFVEPPVTTHRPNRRFKPSMEFAGPSGHSNEESPSHTFAYPRRNNFFNKRIKNSSPPGRLGLPATNNQDEDKDHYHGQYNHEQIHGGQAYAGGRESVHSLEQDNLMGPTSAKSKLSLPITGLSGADQSKNTLTGVESADLINSNSDKSLSTTPNSAVTYGESQWFKLNNDSPPPTASGTSSSNSSDSVSQDIDHQVNRSQQPEKSRRRVVSNLKRRIPIKDRVVVSVSSSSSSSSSTAKLLPRPSFLTDVEFSPRYRKHPIRMKSKVRPLASSTEVPVDEPSSLTQHEVLPVPAELHGSEPVPSVVTAITAATTTSTESPKTDSTTSEPLSTSTSQPT